MRIFSDPHLGLKRKVHTTVNSRKALAERLHTAAFKACFMCKPNSVVCAGDLFDTYSNKEDEIISAAAIANYCDVVLAGNHDLLNQADSVGSLQVVDRLLSDVDVIQCTSFDEPTVTAGELEDMRLAFIPHHATQDLFNEAIELAVEMGEEENFRGIFLHCNYENDMAVGSDTSLNLTKEQAWALLTVSDYVFLGHEHHPRELLDGRLVILGNVHPTSFGDISDKYYWDLYPDRLEKTLCWEEGEKAVVMEFDAEYPAPPPSNQYDFITVTGEITADHGAGLAQYIQDLWHHCDPLMVRNNVTVKMIAAQEIAAVDVENLEQVISTALEGTELNDVWNQYRGQIKC